MNGRDGRLKQLLLELDERTRRRAGKERGISRRRLLSSISGGTVVAAVGIGGLMELLASGEALAVGMQITIDGVTREPDKEEETPHRHLFTVTFQVTGINPDEITGNVNGRADHVISTGSRKEDQHFHVIQSSGVTLEQLVLSGPEDNNPGGHHHPVSIE